MNIWVFLAGVSVGWAADKLYNYYTTKKTHADEGDETLKTATEEKEFAVDNTKSTKKAKKEKKEKINAEKSETKEELLEEIHDDLSQLKGVGPKLVKALDSIGIYNYEQLSELPVDILLERLQKTGGKFNRSTISVIIERAKQAAEER